MSTILALDLGKFKSVSCFFDTDTQELRYVTVESTPATIGLLLDKAKAEGVACVIFEACVLTSRRFEYSTGRRASTGDLLRRSTERTGARRETDPRIPQPVAMELECRDGLNLTGEDGSCQRFSDAFPILPASDVGGEARFVGQEAARRAPRTRNAMWKQQ